MPTLTELPCLNDKSFINKKIYSLINSTADIADGGLTFKNELFKLCAELLLMNRYELELQKYKSFADIVRNCRINQKHYLKTQDKQSLINSKTYEQQIDALLIRLSELELIPGP